jgi:hypothetical protein
MTSKRLFFVLIGVLVLLSGLAGAGTWYGNGMLQKKGQQLTALKLQKSALDKKETSLAGAKKDITAYAELESIAKSIVPQEKDQALTVREIVSLAGESGISLSSIQFPDSKLGIATPKSSASSADDTKKAPATNTGTTQFVPIKSLPGVYAMDITIESNKQKPTQYAQLLNFLEKLEHNRHTANVTDISIHPAKDNRRLVTFTLTLQVYIKP